LGKDGKGEDNDHRGQESHDQEFNSAPLHLFHIATCTVIRGPRLRHPLFCLVVCWFGWSRQSKGSTSFAAARADRGQTLGLPSRAGKHWKHSESAL